MRQRSRPSIRFPRAVGRAAALLLPLGALAVSAAFPGAAMAATSGHQLPAARSTAVHQGGASKPLAAPALIPGVHQVQLPGIKVGSISGAVLASNGAGLAGACVQAVAAGGHAAPVRAVSGAHGAYELSGLKPGNYELSVTRCQSALVLARGEVKLSADHVAITANLYLRLAGGPTADAAALRPAGPAPAHPLLATTGSISGTVTSSTGTGLAGICVSVSAFNFAATVTTGSGGSYSVINLAPGFYSVGFAPGCGDSSSLALQYYPDTPYPNDSGIVQVNAGQVTGAIDASMQPGGSISGTVTNSSGSGLSGICVTDFATGAFTTTGSLGTYTLPDLPIGGAFVGMAIEDGYASNCGSNLTYSGYQFPGAPTVTAGGTTANVDAILSPGGSITGTVTNTSGAVLGGMCVQAGQEPNSLSPSINTFETTTTSATGTYTLSGLDTGSYEISVTTGCGGSLAYAGAYYQQGAAVGVTASQTTSGIDVTLQQGGSISGTVTTGAGSPAGICVQAFPQGIGASFALAATSTSGAYSLPQLAAGLYTVAISTGCGGTASLIGTTVSDVAVADLQTTSGVNATLSAAGAISGTVTAGGHAAAGVCVNASGTTGGSTGISAYATTSPSGTYTVADLPAGSYTVEFYSGCSGSASYVTQYYNDQATLGSANLVTVTGTSTTTGINAVMQLAGGISGTVQDASGIGLPGLCVDAFTTTSLAAQATSGSDGAYTIPGLAPGAYNVQFVDGPCENGGGYPIQWYDNQPLVTGTPQAVTVVSGQTTTGIGDTMLPITGSISGTVTDTSGTDLAGICVYALGTNPGDGNGTATLSNGTYTITGLAADTYEVQFLVGGCGSTGNYLTQYWDNQLAATGTPGSVTVTTGQAVTAINDALATGGSISGVVTDATTGAALPGICVSASGNVTLATANGETGAGGAYTLTGLPTDSYSVSFSASGCGNNGPYAIQYYDNATSLGTATLVSVTAGTPTTGIGDALQYAYPVGSVSGTVTDSSGAPIGGICVALVAPSGSIQATAVTAANGTYQMTLQPASTGYSVAFFTGCGNQGNYATEFYGNGVTYPGTSVTINSGANTGSINAVLTTLSSFPAGTPSAPGTPTGTAEPSAVSLSWTPPASSGTSPISGYLVTPSIGGAAQPALQTNSSQTTYTVTGLTDGTGYTFTVAAENASGTGPASSSSTAVTPAAPNPATYNPLTPYRICDTRGGNPSGLSGPDLTQCEGKTLNAGSTLTIQVAGTNPSGQSSGGVPSGATSVVLNVTVTNTTVPSYLTVYPAGGTRPLSSSVNWNGGQTVPNLVTVVLGTNGDVSLYNANGSTDVVVDVEGWYDSTGASGGPYVPLTPYRICDTRPPVFTPQNQCTGKTLQAGTTLTIQVAGTNPLGTTSGGVPASGVLAVDLTVTATDPTVPSYLTVWPAGATRPTASNLNFVGGETVANNVVVAVPQSGADAGEVSIYNPNGSTDVVVDVSGYYATTTTGTGLFVPMVPYRICDTRSTAISGLSDSCTGHTLVAFGTSGAVLVLQVAGIGGIPANATSVVLNVTVTDTTAADYLTVYPDGSTRPNSSSLNWPAGETVASGVTATLGADGALDFYIPQGAADLVVDVVGWEK